MVNQERSPHYEQIIRLALANLPCKDFGMFYLELLEANHTKRGDTYNPDLLIERFQAQMANRTSREIKSAFERYRIRLRLKGVSEDICQFYGALMKKPTGDFIYYYFKAILEEREQADEGYEVLWEDYSEMVQDLQDNRSTEYQKHYQRYLAENYNVPSFGNLPSHHPILQDIRRMLEAVQEVHTLQLLKQYQKDN